MSSISHEPPRAVHEKRPLSLRFLVPEMWASLAIVVVWLSVLFAAVYGPNIENTSAGGDTSNVPSAVAMSLFAFLATWVIARYGFRRGSNE